MFQAFPFGRHSGVDSLQFLLAFYNLMLGNGEGRRLDLGLFQQYLGCDMLSQAVDIQGRHGQQCTQQRLLTFRQRLHWRKFDHSQHTVTVDHRDSQ